jgi:hypothetical protein
VFVLLAVGLILPAAMMLDGGRFVTLASVAVVAHMWTIVAMLFRGGARWHTWDRVIVRFGVLVTLAITAAFAWVMR